MTIKRTAIKPRNGFASGSQPGIKLAYADWGPEDASPEKTIVGVHGITANLIGWNAFAEKLAASGYRFIAYDLRGRGESSKPANGYDLTTHSFDLRALLDYFNIEQANVLGHSLGAAIGVYFSAHYPERVRRLILLDGGAPLPPDTWQAIARSLERLGKTFPSLEAYISMFKVSPYFPIWNDSVENYYTYDVKQNPDGTVTPKCEKEAIMEEQHNLNNMEKYLSALHTHIEAPTLILRATDGLLDSGKAGFILTAEGSAKMAQNIQGGGKTVDINGTNHFTILMNEGHGRDEVLRLVIKHLE
ncbi:alpha/beta hydrolase [Candidatus Chlorohelix sp.]|uniref:alpha/beta fold hydrolase n=1 Tax=Candidatus Chlorohelix sp. TaxID=3139201 RepID=UPI00305AE32E